MMTTQKYFVPTEGAGLIPSGASCLGFSQGWALKGFAMNSWYFPTLGKNLVTTKVWVTHPTRASKSVGVVIFKRLVTHVCTGAKPSACRRGDTVADVYKIGYCIRCPKNFFGSV